jgi:serine/threonine-protein kinase RsbT
MGPGRTETFPLRTDEDVLRVRQTVRIWMVEQRTFSLVEQTKMVTATSELGRNVVVHGGGGTARLELLADGGRTGMRVTFQDQGPGIANVEQALKDGFTTGDGLGLGLGGSRRLVDDFEIGSEPGKGTRVTITKWK